MGTYTTALLYRTINFDNIITNGYLLSLWLVEEKFSKLDSRVE